MDETAFDIRSIVGLLRRQIRLIAAVFVATVGLAGLFAFSLTPIFSASALLVVDPGSANLLDPDPAGASAASDNSRIDTEVEILRSEALLLEVILEMDLLDDPEFGARPGAGARLTAFLRGEAAAGPTGEAGLRQVLNRLRAAVSVQRRGVTRAIAIEARSVDPARAALLANTVAEASIRNQVQSRVDGLLAARAVLEDRLAQAGAALVQSEQALDDFIGGPIAETAAAGAPGLLGARLEALGEERARLETVAALAGQSYGAGDWAGLAATLQSEALGALEAERAAGEQRLAQAGPDSPLALDLRAELAALDARLEQTAAEALEGLRASLSRLDSQTSDLRRQIRSDMIGEGLPLDMLTRLYQLQQTAELARSQYQTLLARSADLGMQSDLQLAESRLVSRALTPDRPRFPDIGVMLGLAGFLGLGLGVGLAFVHENYVGGFTSQDQIAAVLKLPVLAEVPRRKPGEGAVADAMVRAPLSLYAESIRRLRAGIDHLVHGSAGGGAPGPRRGVVVMISSAAPEEGKTTLALSLARAYALSGRSTLLIDCDLRKPGVHRQLGIEPAAGLLDYLVGAPKGEALAAMLSVDEASGLNVLTGARRSESPTDQLVIGGAFSALIEAATANFDVIVLDTPPVEPVVDSLYLAAYADIVAFVIRWAGTAQSEARSAIGRLAAAMPERARIVAVLNQQDAGRSAYKSRYAGYYRED